MSIARANCRFEFEKRSQLFVGVHNEALTVVAVCISNEDRLSVGINRCDATPTPTRFAEIVSDDFPELHVDRIVPLLVSTQQSQNDMNAQCSARQHSSLLRLRFFAARRGSGPERGLAVLQCFNANCLYMARNRLLNAV